MAVGEGMDTATDSVELPTFHTPDQPAIQTSRPESQLGDESARPGEAHGDIENDVDSKIFEVSWSGDNDPMNPRSMTLTRKWMVVLILSLSSICVTCTSSLYTATYKQLEREFKCSRIVATLGLSLFVVGLGIGPMVLAPLSEFYGRKPIYWCSFTAFFVFTWPSAFAQNIQTMLVARFLDGLAGSAFLSVAGGTVGDMFSKTDLQLPMMVYTASPFIGPELGPLIGGFINQYTGWRWSFYTLLIWEGINLVLILAFIPETYHPVLLREKAKSERAQTGEPRYFAPIERMTKSIRSTVALSIFRPLQMLVLEPMCLNLCLFSAILLGVLYLFFGAFALIFETNHGFEQYQVGLSFLGLFVGMLLGVATDPIWHRNYQQLVRKREAAGGEPGGSEPEYRLPSAIVGAPLVTIGLFWFGWTTRASIHWIIPIIGSGVFALGILFIGKVLTTRRTLLVFSGVFTFLVDAYPLYAASAMAANSFARSSFAAAFPLFGIQMYQKLGYEWATSLLAFLTLVLAPFPYIFYKNGKRLREKSRFA